MGFMAEWLIKEARQIVMNKQRPDHQLIDISNVGVLRHPPERFGREVWKAVIYGESLLVASFYSDSQVKLLKT